MADTLPLRSTSVKSSGWPEARPLQSRLFDRADVDEDIFAAIVARDEAETLGRVEELDDAIAFANDLRRHPAAASAAEAAATTTIATAETAAAATAAVTTAEAAGTVTATEAAAVAEATATIAAAIAVAAIGSRFEAVEIAEIIALAASPLAAAILVETHCLIVAFGSSTPIQAGALRRTGTQFTMGTDSPRAADDVIYSLNRWSLRTENYRPAMRNIVRLVAVRPACCFPRKTSH